MHRQLGTTRPYSLWPSWGTALYACGQARGGTGHVVTAAKPQPTDETTPSLIEVTGSRLVRRGGASREWRGLPPGHLDIEALAGCAPRIVAIQSAA